MQTKTNKFLNKIKEYFPDSKQKWKQYFLTSIPVIFAAMIFALNAFVDNFMSTNIEGGNQALSYANTWTELIIGIISLTTIIGSAIFAQFLGKREMQKVKEVINIRILFALFIAIGFALPSWIIPNEMISLISGFDQHILDVVKNSSAIYLRLIAVSWVINSIWFTITMILREKNHVVVSFLSSLISLILNIILNSIFVFGFNFGIEFLAYSTIISNIISLGFVLIFIYIKDKEISINFFKIFVISRQILKLFFARIWSFILLSIGSIAITIRFVFWNIGYPTGSIGQQNYQLSAANILGISGMFFNIFWTALEAVNANVAIYVGRELGANNFDAARKNAKDLQGFHLIISLIMSLLLFALSFIIQEMTFLANGYKDGLINYLNSLGLENAEIIIIAKDGVNLFLTNLKYTLWPLSLFMPIFIWFITRSRVISNGGHTNLIGAVEAIIGILQLGWLCLICLVMNKNNNLSFPLSYFIFYLLDLLKFTLYEILYYKINWVKNITKDNKNIDVNESEKIENINNLKDAINIINETDADESEEILAI